MTLIKQFSGVVIIYNSGPLTVCHKLKGCERCAPMYLLAVCTQGEGRLCDKVTMPVLLLKEYIKSMTLVSLWVFRTKRHTQVRSCTFLSQTGIWKAWASPWLVFFRSSIQFFWYAAKAVTRTGPCQGFAQYLQGLIGELFWFMEFHVIQFCYVLLCRKSLTF